MTKSPLTAAAASPSTTDPVALATAVGVDPAVVLALIDEVDDIFCAPADVPTGRRPATPAVRCALHGPRRAGWWYRREYPRPQGEPVRHVDPMQRSPPPS